MAIPFVRDMDFTYGEVSQVSPLIRRVVANNPGPFTFRGTGVYIVGNGDVAVIDPGPDDPDHLQALQRALAGARVTHILVTHRHLDHCPAARPLAQATGATIYATGIPAKHGAPVRPEGGGANAPQTEEGEDLSFRPDAVLKDGEVFRGATWTLEALFTPGHTGDHVCFALREENALFSGDHIMGWSTTVISPPDGDMAAYFASLEKVRARNFDTLWPTHGPPVKNVNAFIDAYVAHRLAREAQVLAHLAAGKTRIGDMIPLMYADVDHRLWPAAAHSVLAHMVKLVREGRVRTDGEPGIGSEYVLA